MSEDEAAPDDVVAAVADEIRATHAIQPLSEEARVQRELDNQLWREEQQWRAEQRRLERERAQAKAAEQARREAAIAAEAARRKAQAEARERYAREAREREIAELRLQTKRQGAWQRDVEIATRTAVLQQHRQALMADLECMINPPPPPPEPEVIFIERSDGSPHLGPDYNPKLAGQAVLRWR
jgi:colicin import membrane protein